MFEPTYNKKVLAYKRQLLMEVFNKLKPEQQAFFIKVLQSEPAKVPESKIGMAYDLCERTIWKNEEKQF